MKVSDGGIPYLPRRHARPCHPPYPRHTQGGTRTRSIIENAVKKAPDIGTSPTSDTTAHMQFNTPAIANRVMFYTQN